MKKIIYVVHAQDGNTHLSQLTSILDEFKNEERINDYQLMSSEGISRQSFSSLTQDDMVIILLTQGIENHKATIEAPLLDLKRRDSSYRVVEIIADNIPFETEFLAFPANLQPISNSENQNLVWSNVKTDLGNLLPLPDPTVEEEKDEKKNYLPYILGVLGLLLVVWVLIEVIPGGSEELEPEFSMIVQDPINDIVTDASECYVPCKIIGINETQDADKVVWHVGDSIIEDVAKPIHVFLVPDKYNITLEAKNKNGSKKVSKLLHVKGLPYANFEVENEGCKAPCDIEFVNKSENASKFSWSFVNGTSPNTSNSADPGKRTYSQDGDFSVKLTVENEMGISSDTTQTITIKKDATPFADFKYSRKGGLKAKPPYSYQFTSTSNNANQYFWEILKGNTRIHSDTRSTFSKLLDPGTYTVKLMVTGDGNLSDDTFRNMKVSDWFIKPQFEMTTKTIDPRLYNKSILTKIMKTNDSLKRKN